MLLFGEYSSNFTRCTFSGELFNFFPLLKNFLHISQFSGMKSGKMNYREETFHQANFVILGVLKGLYNEIFQHFEMGHFIYNFKF